MSGKIWWCDACGRSQTDRYGKVCTRCGFTPGEPDGATHELKTWPAYFDAVRQDSKPFEVRKDDRGFKRRDLLILREWNPETKEYTGRKLYRRVTYVLPGPGFGIEAGHVVLGLAYAPSPPESTQIGPQP